MRFLTWNIQSGGGKRISSIAKAVEELSPDFVALTEVTSGNLTQLQESLSRQGLTHIATTCDGGRGYSVLVASKMPFDVETDNIEQDQERWLAVYLPSVELKVLSIHIPGTTDDKFGADGYGISGKMRKKRLWNEVIRYATQNKDQRVVLLGDFNTGLEEDAQGTPFELSHYMRVLYAQNYTDVWRSLHPNAREFTWYTKRKNKETGISEDYNGFRLDYVFVSPCLRDNIVSGQHIHTVRKEKLSDHAIVVADLAVESHTLSFGTEKSKPSEYTYGLGELIRAHRLYMGLSKDGMAKQLGMRDDSYDPIENGRAACPPGLLETIDSIMRRFDQEVQALVARANDKCEIKVEVSRQPSEEWRRCVVGRAAIESGRILPVLIDGPPQRPGPQHHDKDR
ncbi:endonuclease/exonuclease/phosphatase family protein [Mycobacterium intermedium]